MLSSAKSRVLLAAAAVALAAAPAVAGTDSAILTVRVTVQEACTIEGGTLDFGTYSSGQQVAADADGTISVNNCAASTLEIALDGGTASDIANRKMANGDSTLQYQLYKNSARNQLWGTGDDSLKQQLLVPGSLDIGVYGRVPGGQNVPGGTYTDTVNVTLTF